MQYDINIQYIYRKHTSPPPPTGSAPTSATPPQYILFNTSMTGSIKLIIIGIIDFMENQLYWIALGCTDVRSGHYWYYGSQEQLCLQLFFLMPLSQNHKLIILS